MSKLKIFVPVCLLAVLALVGAGCQTTKEKEKTNGLNPPFQGKQKETRITDNKVRDYYPRVSGDGRTIVFWTDSDSDRYLDSIVVAGPKGEIKKEIKIKGGIFDEKFGFDAATLDISRQGNKIAFVGCPFVENWWSVNPMPEYVYVVDLATEKAAKIDPQDLPERVYPKEYDAERADAARVALNDDGSLVAFTTDVWGVDFGEIHDVIDDDMVLIAKADASSEPIVLEKGINAIHVAMDSQDRVFYVKTDNKDGSKFELSVVNADGSGKRGLGINVTYSGYNGVTVSSDGRVAGILREEGVIFVSDDQGNIIAKGTNGNANVISGDGKRVLVYDLDFKKPENERGLVFYKVDEDFKVEQILKPEDYKVYSPYFDVSDSANVVVSEFGDKEEGDEEILTITWQ